MSDPDHRFRDSADNIRPGPMEEEEPFDDRPPLPSSGTLTADEKQWAMFCHLSAIIASLVSGISILGPLICWMIKKDSSKFVDRHGKEALNYHLNMMVWVLISIPIAVVTCGVGAVLTGAIYIYALVMSVIAGMKANSGEEYQYPAIIRVIK